MEENASCRGILTHRYEDLSSFSINHLLVDGKRDFLFWRDIVVVGEDIGEKRLV